MKTIDYITREGLVGQDPRFARLRNRVLDGLTEYDRLAPAIQLLAVTPDMLAVRVSMTPSDGGPRPCWGLLHITPGWSGPTVDLRDHSPDATLQDVRRLRTFARTFMLADAPQDGGKGACRYG